MITLLCVKSTHYCRGWGPRGVGGNEIRAPLLFRDCPFFNSPQGAIFEMSTLMKFASIS